MKHFQNTTKLDGSKRCADDSSARIEAAIQRIPRGRVSSYGQVADLAGLPGRARLTARVLRASTQELPWHRVLRSNGAIAFPAGSAAHIEQTERLRAEGVVVRNGRVDLRTAGYQPLLELLARDLLGLEDGQD